MESDKELKSLKRGLSALLLMNQNNIISISELSRQLGLPRTTGERIMMTLASEGYAMRVYGEKGFRLAPKVRALSMGFSEQDWVVQSSAPLLFETTRRIGWPLGIATLHGPNVALQITTDPATSLWLARRYSGIEIPILIASTGMVCLAFLPLGERDTLVNLILDQSRSAPEWLHDKVQREERFDKIRQNGYCFSPPGGDSGLEDSIAVPIMVDGQLMGALMMVFMVRALKKTQVIDEFLPQLNALAREIGDSAALRPAEPVPEKKPPPARGRARSTK